MIAWDSKIMLQGERVTLRAARREDLPLLNQFSNHLEVELAQEQPAGVRGAVVSLTRIVRKGARRALAGYDLFICRGSLTTTPDCNPSGLS